VPSCPGLLQVAEDDAGFGGYIVISAVLPWMEVKEVMKSGRCRSNWVRMVLCRSWRDLFKSWQLRVSNRRTSWARAELSSVDHGLEAAQSWSLEYGTHLVLTWVVLIPR
jgi:hypothetical protein